MSPLMRVTKRGGQVESVDFNKIFTRIQKLSFDLDVDVIEIAKKTISGLYDLVTTSELDVLAAETSAALVTRSFDYCRMASRICASNLQKQAPKTFSEAMFLLNEARILNPDLYTIIEKHKDVLDSQIMHELDLEYDFFGFKTLERSYLQKVDGMIVETPQYMLLRVSLGLHYEDIEQALECYKLMSLKTFTLASPTLFNSGTRYSQLSSCFISHVDDSLTSIYKTLGDCAQISKLAGGIGLDVNNIRSTGSHIEGTNGTSSGLLPMLRVFNETARYVNQSGKRLGSIVIYLEPWHPDIFQFLDMRKNSGNEHERARDLFSGMWIPDLFMQRVEEDADWTLFCPKDVPDLAQMHGSIFKDRYEEYEQQGRARKVVKARDVWNSILVSQIETGTPYILYKDSINRHSNHSHLGTIRSSNLCAEITLYTSEKETAVCNLASINLSAFVKYNDEKKVYYDFDELRKVSSIAIKNLDIVIDRTYYPIPETKVSNLRHRPVGLGVQGLQNVFFMMRLPFDSEEAMELNKNIFETIYFGALSQSIKLARDKGPFPSYTEGSVIGRMTPDSWDCELGKSKWDWDSLRQLMKEYGVRNSMLTACMPTASTASILGNVESFEPITSNLYTRRVLSGEFIMINKYLQKDLACLNLWNDSVRMQLIANNGSIQDIASIPDDIKKLYRTAFELSMKTLIDQSRDRCPFVCQSQSLNLFVDTPTHSKLGSMHFYAWKQGLKTGMYYLRTKPKADPIKFTIDQAKLEEYRRDDSVCESCSA